MIAQVKKIQNRMMNSFFDWLNALEEDPTVRNVLYIGIAVCAVFIALQAYMSYTERRRMAALRARVAEHKKNALPAAEKRDYNLAELREFNGNDKSKPLLMGVDGHVYDMSRGAAFYGPGGPYAAFAGRDATRALAKMSFDEEDLDAGKDGLSDTELSTLHDWIEKFDFKYDKVGKLIN
jgi:membrane-associated progesterone receptor component